MNGTKTVIEFQVPMGTEGHEGEVDHLEQRSGFPMKIKIGDRIEQFVLQILPEDAEDEGIDACVHWATGRIAFRATAPVIDGEKWALDGMRKLIMVMGPKKILDAIDSSPIVNTGAPE